MNAVVFCCWASCFVVKRKQRVGRSVCLHSCGDGGSLGWRSFGTLARKNKNMALPFFNFFLFFYFIWNITAKHMINYLRNQFFASLCQNLVLK